MKKVVLTLALFASIGIAFAQTSRPVWKSTVKNTQSTTLENNEVYVGNITAGSYLIEFVINNETVVKRIIKK
jgi:hypothetical protein